mgnify:CR=1 FL=1
MECGNKGSVFDPDADPDHYGLLQGLCLPRPPPCMGRPGGRDVQGDFVFAEFERGADGYVEQYRGDVCRRDTYYGNTVDSRFSTSATV